MITPNPFVHTLMQELDRLGMSQQELARRIPCSQTLVSQWMRGETQVSLRMVRRVCEEIATPAVLASAARWVTGGAFVGPVLDPRRVDMHRLAVLGKWQEEARESTAAIEADQRLLIRPPESLTPAEREQLWSTVLQLVAMERATEYAVGVLCETYGWNVRDAYRAHDDKLYERKYAPRPRLYATSMPANLA